MAGHSKWKQIKHKKEKTDTKRGKVFTKLIREITVAAREGGGDPAGNAHLRLLIEKAKEVNMPQDNFVRAIKKGTGELEGGAAYQPFTYEGYAPNGVAVMVDTLSDNKNRTVADLRHLFTKLGGTLGDSGAVGWMFERKGVIRAQGALTEDQALEKLLDAPVDDIEKNENDFLIQCKVTDLFAAKKAVEQAGLKVENAALEWVAKNMVTLTPDKEEAVYNFIEALDDLDDVQNIFDNIA